MGFLRLDECTFAPIEGNRVGMTRGYDTTLLGAAVGLGGSASRLLVRLACYELVATMYVDRVAYQRTGKGLGYESGLSVTQFVAAPSTDMRGRVLGPGRFSVYRMEILNETRLPQAIPPSFPIIALGAVYASNGIAKDCASPLNSRM